MPSSPQPFLPDLLPNPAQRIDYADPAMIAALGGTNRALARYDALLRQSPCAHLLLGSLTDREAMLSARIEGSQSTLGEVMHFAEDEGIARNREQRDDLNEIRNYVSALNFGAEVLAARPFTLSLLKELHAILLGRGSVRGQRKQPGAFRSRQVWIGSAGADISQATYLPPESIRIPEFMENWAEYCHAEAPAPLVQTAILHAQFELIHPFADGNGRLGRLLIPLCLMQKRMLAQPNFYPSAYLERHRDEYMEALRLLNQKPGEWHNWVLFFLRAVAAQADETTDKIHEIASLYNELKESFAAMRSQFAIPLLDVIFARPIFSRANALAELAKMKIHPSAPTLYNLLVQLVQNGTLHVMRERRGARGAIYKLTQLMELLEAGDK